MYKRVVENLRMPRRSTANRNKIVILHQEGYSQVQIANRVKCSRHAVQQTLKKFQETSDVIDRSKSGRRKKLSHADDHFLKRTALRDRKS